MTKFSHVNFANLFHLQNFLKLKCTQNVHALQYVYMSTMQQEVYFVQRLPEILFSFNFEIDFDKVIFHCTTGKLSKL